MCLRGIDKISDLSVHVDHWLAGWMVFNIHCFKFDNIYTVTQCPLNIM